MRSTEVPNFRIISQCNTIKLSTKPVTVTIAQVDEMIAELSRLFKLQPGDIIMTGTPAGIQQKFIIDFHPKSLHPDHRYHYKIILCTKE